MQIPLDFYRILGVPTRSTPEQLQQAFEDRLQQLPRQEYSNAAIAARKQLLEEAFSELSSPAKRQAYDQKWVDLEGEMADTPILGLPTKVIDKKLAGVLLLLQEVGAYQQILDIGSSYLDRPIDLAQIPTAPGATEGDIVLAMALANLELGREQWQQSQFESAGDSLQSGLALLEKEEKFPDVQTEIRRDLYKLRPYRILELLNEKDAQPRSKGLTLLQAMLNDRDGIDGNQDDQSGLSVNDFLRFIQQLREYLTVAEQQELFEREAERPSAVASYLAVYALIARGVSQGKPKLVQRAKALLSQLGDRQDIAIEMGMCWLLLGQTEAAHQSIMMSQDEASLDFMRQYSEGALDLIPGLYLYTENWLQKEVYPYFRDLVGQTVSLQTYFDDPIIQRELDNLDAVQVSTAQSGTYASGDYGIEQSSLTQSAEATAQSTVPRTVFSKTTQPSANRSWETTDFAWSGAEESLDEVLIGGKSAKGSKAIPRRSKAAPGRSTLPATPNTDNPDELRKKVQQRGSRNRAGAKTTGVKTKALPWLPWAIAALLGVGVVAGALALGRIFKPSAMVSNPSAVSPSGSGSGTGNGSGTFTGQKPNVATSPTTSPATSSTNGSTTSPIPSSTGTPKASVGPTSSPTSSPNGGVVSPSPAVSAAASGPLSSADAKTLVQSWQSAKAEALGPQYNTASLKQVLAEPVRAQWEASSSQSKQVKGHWKYTFDQLDILSIDPLGKDQSIIKAVVKESGQYFEKNKLINSQSYTGDTYKVQYIAVRQKQQWLIKDMQVID